MIENKWLDNEYGLLNAFPDRKDEDENSPLFTIEYLLLTNEGYDFFPPLSIFIHNCRVKNARLGLYNQRPKNNGSHEDYMSPDQLIAFCAFFNIIKLNERVISIWKYLKIKLFTYDNISQKTNFKRLMQPLAVAFVAYSATGSWFWKQVLLACCRLSCKEFANEEYELELMRASYAKDTALFNKVRSKRIKKHKGKNPDENQEASGVLKAFTCLRSLRIKDPYCEKFYKKAFQVYFKPEDHPIRKIVDNTQGEYL